MYAFVNMQYTDIIFQCSDHTYLFLSFEGITAYPGNGFLPVSIEVSLEKAP